MTRRHLLSGTLAAAAMPKTTHAGPAMQDVKARRKELYSLLGDLPDRKRPISAKLVSSEDRPKYKLEKLVLDLNGMEPVPAYFVKPLDAKPGERRPTMLFHHSHGGGYQIGKTEFL